MRNVSIEIIRWLRDGNLINYIISRKCFFLLVGQPVSLGRSLSSVGVVREGKTTDLTAPAASPDN